MAPQRVAKMDIIVALRSPLVLFGHRRLATRDVIEDSEFTRYMFDYHKVKFVHLCSLKSPYQSLLKTTDGVSEFARSCTNCQIVDDTSHLMSFGL